jgi:hypothetical protein
VAETAAPLSRSRFVYYQPPPQEALTITYLNRAVRFAVIADFCETKTS